MIRPLGLLALLAALACGSEPGLTPIVVTPPADTPAYPYVGVDTLSLAVAEAGEPNNLREADFPVDEEPNLPSVPFGSDLVIHFSAVTEGRVSGYGRTCSFNYTATDRPRQLHLYMSRIGRWAESPAPTGFSSGGFAFPTPDGGAGFIGGGAVLTRFDVGSNQYTEQGVELTREQAAYVALDDGRAIVVGGLEDSQPSGQISAVDLRAVPGPDAPVVTTSGSARLFAFGAPLAGGSAVVAGGEIGGLIIDDAVRVVLGGEQGIDTEPLPPLNTARAQAVMTRLGEDAAAPVLVSGGRGNLGAVGDAELYRPLAGDFEPLATALDEPRWGHQAVSLPDRSVLIVGGFVADGVTTGTVELFDASTASYRGILATLADEAGRVGLTATRLPDGRVLLAGGLDASGQPTDAVFIARLDNESGAFSLLQTTSLSRPRVGHSAVLLCDGTVLLVGGAGGGTAERYNPPPDGRR